MSVQANSLAAFVQELRLAHDDLDTDDYGTCTVPPEALRSLLSDAADLLSEAANSPVAGACACCLLRPRRRPPKSQKATA